MEITYYKNPFSDHEKIKTEAETFKQALFNLGIEDKPLCIVVNGKVPEEINLEDKIRDGDIVEIRHIVEGSSAETWSTLVNVATTALIVSGYATGWGAVAVAIGGSLISGAIMKNAQPPVPSLNAQQANDLAIEQNDIGSFSAKNKSRPNEPIPIPMGSISFAPDIVNAPFYPYYNFPDLITFETGYVLVPKIKDDEIFSNQSFSIGFGDFSVGTKFSIGGFDVEKNGEQASYKTMRKVDFDNGGSDYRYAGSEIGAVSVSRKNTINLSNDNDSRGYISPSNMDKDGWTYIQGDYGLQNLMIVIEGVLYGLSSGSYTTNTTTIQVQYKRNSDLVFKNFSPDIDGNTGGDQIIKISNNDSKQFRLTLYMGEGDYTLLPSGGFPIVYDTLWFEESIDELNDFIVVRIRKVTLDSSDNTTSKVSKLSASFVFYGSTIENMRKRSPIEMVGINLSSKLSSSFTAEILSVTVEPRCFVFEDEEWIWKNTRNPAWWFLFFAKGGYKNLDSNFDEAIDIPPPDYPLSPTIGWQNYKHELNTELLFGGGYSLEEIDIEKIKEWAEFCDDQNLKLDLVMRDDVSTYEALNNIAKVGRASVFFNNGLLSVVYEDKNQLPVATFGMSNILEGSFKVDYVTRTKYKSVRIKYSNREKDFESEVIEKDIPFQNENHAEVYEATLAGVTEPSQAEREANLIAGRQYFQTKNYSWKTDEEGFIARRGDVVILSHNAVQYGVSGRIISFIEENKRIVGIETNAELKENLNWIMIRLPNGEFKKLRCKVKLGNIYFIDNFNYIDAPYNVRNSLRFSINEESRFSDSYAEDYIFIADIKETVGKTVRIKSVEQDENNNFSYTAVDEDPALWAFELGNVEQAQSMNDSIGTLEVYSVFWEDLGDGKVKLSWDADDGLYMIIDKKNNQPIDLNGQFSTYEKEVVLELQSGVNYFFEVVPLSINEKVNVKSKDIKFWLQ